MIGYGVYYSCLFDPTTPTLCKPTELTHTAVMHIPEKNQYAARYPIIIASNLSSTPPSSLCALASTVSAIKIASVIPTALPSCAIVLKTPPAKACISAGNEDVISKFEIVNEASAPIGFKNTAGNAASQ